MPPALQPEELDTMPRTIYPTRKDIENRLAEAFPAPQTAVLAGVLDDIRQVEVQRAAECHTDARMGELAEAQRPMDERIGELSEARRNLARVHADMQETMKDLMLMLPAWAPDSGLELEDLSAALLPSWLARYHDIEGLTLGRQHLTLASGEVAEVDLMGTGQRAGEAVVVVGECRARLGGGEARRLADKLDRVAETITERQVVRLIVAMSIHPSAAEVARERDVLLVPYSRINRDRG